MRSVAIAVIALIITMPVAFAADISLHSYYGGAGVEGFSMESDDITIEVIASNGGEEVEAEDVELWTNTGTTGTEFDTCELDSGDDYFCSLETSASAYGLLSYNFTVNLYDDNPARDLLDDAAGVFYVDEIEPDLSFSANKNMTSSDVTFTIDAEDLPGNCSGVKNVTLLKNDEVFHVEYGTLGDCTLQKTLTEDFAAQAEADDYTICAQASDFMGWLSDIECVDVFVDTVPPLLVDAGVYNGSGGKLTHIKPGVETEGVVRVQLYDFSGIVSVEGKFDELGTNGWQAYDDSYQLANSSVYEWEIDISEVDPCVGRVRAEDALDNEMTALFDCTIKADSTPPVFVSATSGWEKNNVILLGKNAILNVTLTDEDDEGNQGAGFGEGYAYMDLSPVGGTNVKADDCVFKDSRWVCSWNIAPSVSGSYQFELLKSTKDDLGNTISAVVPISVITDVTPPPAPYIKERDVLGVDPERDLPARGDTLKYVVTSANFSVAYANFSSIGGQSRMSPVSCVLSDGAQDCLFESEILASGAYTARIDFSFFDEAGNNASVSDLVDVFTLLNDSVNNYWTHSVVCSPEDPDDDDALLIDRAVSSQVGQIGSCSIRLSALSDPNVEVAGITGPASMSACTITDPTYVDDVVLLSSRYSSPNPYFLVQTAPVNAVLNEVNVSCPIYITTEIDGAITRVPEMEMVKFKIHYYNDPIGTISSNMEERVERQFDVVDSFGFLANLREYLGWAESICYLKGVYANFLGIFEGVFNVIGGLEIAIGDIPVIGWVAKPELYGSRVGACESNEANAKAYEYGIAPFLDSFCAIVNCQAVTDEKDMGGWEYAGAGVPWCRDWNSMWNDWMGLSPTAVDVPAGDGETKSYGYQGVELNALPIQDSLLGSTACLCVPGIIRNIDKLRQIECQRATCLAQDYVMQGMSASACDQIHSNLVCNFVVGDVFNIIPPVQVFDQFMDMISEWIADPFSMIFDTVGALCIADCALPEPTAAMACSWARTLSLVGEAWGSFFAIRDAENIFGMTVDNAWCEQAEQAMEDWGYETD